jgi:hypothetical protein
VLLVVEPAQQQQQEVEGRRVHVHVRDALELGDPLEPLLADHRIEVLHLRVVVRVAVILAELSNVALEVPLFHCRYSKRSQSGGHSTSWLDMIGISPIATVRRGGLARETCCDVKVCHPHMTTGATVVCPFRRA